MKNTKSFAQWLEVFEPPRYLSGRLADILRRSKVPRYPRLPIVLRLSTRLEIVWDSGDIFYPGASTPAGFLLGHDGAYVMGIEFVVSMPRRRDRTWTLVLLAPPSAPGYPATVLGALEQSSGSSSATPIPLSEDMFDFTKGDIAPLYADLLAVCVMHHIFTTSELTP